MAALRTELESLAAECIDPGSRAEIAFARAALARALATKDERERTSAMSRAHRSMAAAWKLAKPGWERRQADAQRRADRAEREAAEAQNEATV